MAIHIGRWDCTSCGNIGNLGPKLHCEKCGSPRPENVKFYMASDEEIVTNKKELARAKAGSDWVCAFCNGQNPAIENTCNSCGASKNDSEKKLQTRKYNTDSVPYSSSQITNKPVQKNTFNNNKKSSPSLSKATKIGCLYIPASLLGLFIIFMLLMNLFTSPIEVQVVDMHWERKINVEHYVLLTESDWKLPAKAKFISKQQAIHHYNQVQTGTVTKTRDIQVKVGEETYVCGKKDLGNGYFEDEYCTRYIYETQTETYEEPVYRQDPVYMTQYTYKIRRWRKAVPLINEGKNKNVKWPVFYGDTIRAIDSTKEYLVYILDNSNNKVKEKLNYKYWKNIGLHDELKAKKSTIFGLYLGLDKDVYK